MGWSVRAADASLSTVLEEPTVSSQSRGAVSGPHQHRAHVCLCGAGWSKGNLTINDQLPSIDAHAQIRVAHLDAPPRRQEQHGLALSLPLPPISSHIRIPPSPVPADMQVPPSAVGGRGGRGRGDVAMRLIIAVHLRRARRAPRRAAPGARADEVRVQLPAAPRNRMRRPPAVARKRAGEGRGDVGVEEVAEGRVREVSGGREGGGAGVVQVQVRVRMRGVRVRGGVRSGGRLCGGGAGGARAARAGRGGVHVARRGRGGRGGGEAGHGPVRGGVGADDAGLEDGLRMGAKLVGPRDPHQWERHRTRAHAGGAGVGSGAGADEAEARVGAGGAGATADGGGGGVEGGGPVALELCAHPAACSGGGRWGGGGEGDEGLDSVLAVL